MKSCSARPNPKFRANEFLSSALLLGCVNGIFCPAAFSHHPTTHCQPVEDSESAITAYEDLWKRLQSLDEENFQAGQTRPTAGFFSLLDGINISHKDIWPFIRDNLARVSGIELPAIELDTVRNDIVDLMRDIKLPLTAASYATLFDEIAKRIAKFDNPKISLEGSTAPSIKREALGDVIDVARNANFKTKRRYRRRVAYSLTYPRMTKDPSGVIEQNRVGEEVFEYETDQKPKRNGILDDGIQKKQVEEEVLKYETEQKREDEVFDYEIDQVPLPSLSQKLGGNWKWSLENFTETFTNEGYAESWCPSEVIEISHL